LFVGIVVVIEDFVFEIYVVVFEVGVCLMVSLLFFFEELWGCFELVVEWGCILCRYVSGEGLCIVECGRMVSVVGAKGGVGIIFVVMLLVHELVLLGCGVVFVDFDLCGGNIGFYVDVIVCCFVVDFVEVVCDLFGCSICEVVVDYVSGVILILVFEDVERVDDMIGEVARLIFVYLCVQFDVVVVDCGL